MSPAGYQSVIVRRGCAETTDAVTASAATRNHTTGRHFSDSQRLQRFRDHCQAKGLAITAFEAGFLRHMTVHQDPAVRAQAVTEVRKSVQVARSLGTDLIYLHSAPHPSWTIEFRRLYDEFSPPTRVEVPAEFSWDAAWAEYVGMIRDLVGEAEAGGVRLALEVRDR